MLLGARRVALAGARVGVRERRSRGWGAMPGGRALAWGLVAGVVVALAALWVSGTGMRPGYDAFGWLDWGRQALHLDLDTNGAPSWKPLTFLFTALYAPAGQGVQMRLWMLTAAAGALAGAVFAARVAYRLAGARRAWAGWVAGAFGAVGVLGIAGYARLVLVADSDPLIVALCLAAVDAHLAGRRRLAFWMLALAAFGRPEAAVLLCLYAVWLWRAAPSHRAAWLLGVALVPAAWFVVPALTSHSWFVAGDLALGSPNVIHGSKLIGVIERFRGLFELPMQLAVLCAIVLAVLRRDRVWLALIAAAGLWVAVEIALAYHGYSAVPRYLIEPAAIMIVLAGATVGRILDRAPRLPGIWRYLALIAVAALVLSLAPAARQRARLAHAQIDQARSLAIPVKRLRAAVRAAGGAALLRSCGAPVTILTYQSQLAWLLGTNVGDVGFDPQRAIARRQPIVLFQPAGDAWVIEPIHTTPAERSRCATLARSYPPS